MLKHSDFTSSISQSIGFERDSFFSEVFCDNSVKATELARVYKDCVRSLYDYGMQMCGFHDTVMNGLYEVFLQHSRRPEASSGTSFIKTQLFRTLRLYLIHSMVRHGNQWSWHERHPFKVLPIWQPLRVNYGGFGGLHSLTGEQRELIFLRWHLGFKYVEIADITDTQIESIHNLATKISELLCKKIQVPRYPAPVL